MKRVPILYLSFCLLAPAFGWADNAVNTPTSTQTPTPTIQTPTASTTPDVSWGRKYYAFDAVLKNTKDPLSDPEGIAISPATGGLIIG
jgi:hypothetical protein